MDNKLEISFEYTLFYKVLESNYNKFLEWVENTALFNAIKNDPHGTQIQSESISLCLNKYDKHIAKATDLPEELLIEFYKNSPFYNPSAIIPSQQKTIKESTN